MVNKKARVLARASVCELYYFHLTDILNSRARKIHFTSWRRRIIGAIWNVDVLFIVRQMYKFFLKRKVLSLKIC